MSINGTKLKSIDENSEKFIFDSVLRLSLYRAFKSQLEIKYGSTDQTHIQNLAKIRNTQFGIQNGVEIVLKDGIDLTLAELDQAARTCGMSAFQKDAVSLVPMDNDGTVVSTPSFATLQTASPFTCITNIQHEPQPLSDLRTLMSPSNKLPDLAELSSSSASSTISASSSSDTSGEFHFNINSLSEVALSTLKKRNPLERTEVFEVVDQLFKQLTAHGYEKTDPKCCNLGVEALLVEFPYLCISEKEGLSDKLKLRFGLVNERYNVPDGWVVPGGK